MNYLETSFQLIYRSVKELWKQINFGPDRVLSIFSEINMRWFGGKQNSYLFIYAVLGIEPKASHMLSKYSTTQITTLFWLFLLF
jgi:hypothetical protein